MHGHTISLRHGRLLTLLIASAVLGGMPALLAAKQLRQSSRKTCVPS